MNKRWIWGSFLVVALAVGGFWVHHKKCSHKLAQEGAGSAYRAISSKYENPTSQQEVIDNITEAIISEIRVADDVELVINQLIKKYGKKEYPAVKLYLSVLERIFHFKSILWRFRAIVEEADLIHAAAIVNLRTFRQKDYLYGKHTLAFFDYFTRPTKDPNYPMYKSISQIQGEILPLFIKMCENIIGELDKLWKVPARALEFDIDRRILVGGVESDASNLGSNEIRYLDPEQMKKRFIKPYIRGIQFIVERLAGTAMILSVVNMDELPAIWKRITFKTAINYAKEKLKIWAFGKKKMVAKGLSPEIIFNEIKKSDKFLTSKLSKGKAQNLLDKAKKLFRDAARHEHQLYVCGIVFPVRLENDSNYDIDSSDKNACTAFDGIDDNTHINEKKAQEYVLNANFMLVDRVNKKRAYQQIDDLFHDERPATITSKVTGQDIEIDIDALFTYRKDYRVFLPISFNGGNKKGSHGRRVNGQWVWNYQWGRPLTWKSNWSKIFPQIKGDGRGTGAGSIFNLLRQLELTESLVPFATLLTAP